MRQPSLSSSTSIAGRPRASLLSRMALAAALGFAGAQVIIPQGALAQRAPDGGIVRLAPSTFADLVEKVKPSVVSIQVSSGSTARPQAQAPGQAPGQRPGQPPRGQLPEGFPNLPEDNPLRRFFEEFNRGQGGGAPALPSQSQGSGFIISADGLVVTNNHVVANGDTIKVKLDDGTLLDAEKVGTDPRTDLALLRIKGNRTFPAVKFAAKEPRVGDWVLAIGNPFGFGGTVTAGIVSALARDVGSGPYDFLQIDAAVNRGNSGGPTFNLEGEVVGVNTAIVSPSGGNVGIAFAVPSRTAVEVIQQLQTSGSVSRGWLGVKIQSLDQDTAAGLGLGEAKGAIISEVTAGGPAALSGLRDGDTILSINGARVEDSRDLARKVAAFAPNTEVQVRVLRGGREQTLPVKLGNFADASGPQAPAQKAPEPKAVAAIPLDNLGISVAAGATRGPREGVAITEVKPGTDAATKGIRAGDQILEVGGQPVSSSEDVAKALAEAERSGRPAVIIRIRSGENSRYVGVQFAKKG
ncbi:MAG: putative periplasmic serine endoprotease DegP-like [Pseudomonadota bacterium]